MTHFFITTLYSCTLNNFEVHKSGIVIYKKSCSRHQISLFIISRVQFSRRQMSMRHESIYFLTPIVGKDSSITSHVFNVLHMYLTCKHCHVLSRWKFSAQESRSHSCVLLMEQRCLPSFHARHDGFVVCSLAMCCGHRVAF